jgi:hypothetical protein
VKALIISTNKLRHAVASRQHLLKRESDVPWRNLLKPARYSVTASACFRSRNGRTLKTKLTPIYKQYLRSSFECERAKDITFVEAKIVESG